MYAVLQNCKLKGNVSAVSSKSQAHRALICSAMSNNSVKISMNSMNNDISATIECLKSMGGNITSNKTSVIAEPVKSKTDCPVLDCGESGSTLRFLLPVCATLFEKSSFSGSGNLPNRPVFELIKALETRGMRFSSKKLPFTMTGKLTPGKFEIPGDVSSQYISGLLMALPLLDGDSDIIYTTPPKSSPYIDMTVDMLEKFSVIPIRTAYGFHINGLQSYISPTEINIEGDWSNSAFWLCAGALNGDVTVKNLNFCSSQGDKIILDYLRRFGANTEVNGDTVNAKKSVLHGTDIDISENPDLLPVLAVTATWAEGKTTLYNAARLRLKECDRLAATADIINSLGGQVTEYEDKLEITGSNLVGGTISSYNDHRIAMSAAVASLMCSGQTIITEASAVNKSYPAFFEDFKELGGKVHLCCEEE